MEVGSSFVALFDILGFKRLRQEKGTANLFKLYDKIIKEAAIRAEKILKKDPNETFQSLQSQYCRVFSDTIVLSSGGNSFHDFIRMVIASYSLLQIGFIASRAPLRGAIGYGDLLVNDNIIIGSAIEDAYFCEQEQVWSGCCLTHNCSEFCSAKDFINMYKAIEFDYAKILVDYDVPVKKKSLGEPGCVQYYVRPGIAIDWTLEVFEGAAKKSFYPAQSEHEEKIASNTVAFEAYARSVRNAQD